VWSQSHLYFATAAETFWDSSAKVKVRKLTKGECVLVENMELYKKKFLYATCLRDGKAGFIDKSFLKYEKTYFPDSVGNHPLEFARKEYAKPFIRLMNTNKNSALKITFGPNVYDLKAGQSSNFFYKPGMQRYKVVAPGYQPLYDQVICSPNHITELEFYTE
jgi:hypothetical protein